MNKAPGSPRRTRPTLRSSTLAALAAVGALSVTSCSAADVTLADPAPSSSTAESAAKEAKTALNAGLEAQTAGDLETAAQHYNETLTIDPENKFASYNLALIDEANGNYGLAEEKYRAALEVDPAYGPALFNLAILRTGRDPQEAISLYRRAAEADKKDAAVWMNLGLLLRASGKKAAGNEAVQKAVKLNPDLVDPAVTGSPTE